MKISGMEIPDAVVAEIVAKAKTKELFKEFIEKMKWEWDVMKKNPYVSRELTSRQNENPEGKVRVAVKFEYHDDILEIGFGGWYGNIALVVLYLKAYDLRMIHERLFKHIKETYDIDYAEYYPTLFVDDGMVQFRFKESPQVMRLIHDIKEEMKVPSIAIVNGVESITIK